jgi:hypothetical protein
MKTQQELIDQVTTWELVAKEYGKDPIKWLPYENPKDSDEISLNAFFKLTKIIRLFKLGVITDFSNPAQEKYFAWLRYKKDKSGLGFSNSNTFYDYTITCVGPRLSFNDLQICEHIYAQFSSIVDEYHQEDLALYKLP